MQPLLVRIVRDWPYPADFFRQLPGRVTVYSGVEFTEDPVDKCDYLIVLQRPPYEICTQCPKGNAWLITQEPPADFFKFHRRSFKYFDKVFSYFTDVNHPHVQTMQPVLPWHVAKSYDELMAVTKRSIGHKQDELVWITSDRRAFPGHKARMDFKDYLLRVHFDFHLYGTGFQPIADKFDGLFPYKYALAIENSSVDHYWTEKLADCFLSWCLPFYWGAPNLEDYFPPESFIRIDIHKPEEALRIIRQTIANREWEKRIDAIEMSRNLILNKYQFFPYLAGLIQQDVISNKKKEMRQYTIPENPFPLKHKVTNLIKYYYKRISDLFLLK